MPYYVDQQIPNPLPEGCTVFVPPDSYSAPVLVSANEAHYWLNVVQYTILPPPPEGHVHVVVSDELNQIYGRQTPYQIRTMPAPPPGESWHVIGSYGMAPLVVPDWCAYTPFRIPTTRFAAGPSVRYCHARCLYSDGCGQCNPDVWAVCTGGHCSTPDNFRVPREVADRGECLCFGECSDCQSPVSQYNLTYLSGGYQVCDDCVRENYTRCDHCNRLIADSDLDEHGETCRESCTEECCYTSRPNLIHDYSYTPYLQFRGEDTYYLGLEVELSGNSDTGEAAQKVTDTLADLVYLKEDSSIGDEGFEVVTHPMSFAFAKEVDWSILSTLRDRYGMEATSDCGLHIHVSKTAFDTASHTYRWMRFIYRNAREIQLLARRRSNGYANFESHMNDWAIHYAIASKKMRYMGEAQATDWYTNTPVGIQRRRTVGLPTFTHRYAAINVENEKTFEMRFFASTTNPTELLAAIEFARASVEYTRQLTAHKVVTQKGLRFDVFREWLENNNTNDQYDNVISEINRLVG